MSRKALFKNAQWMVTKYGLESIRPYNYPIEARRLTETSPRRGNRAPPLYDWPAHMAGKTWVDIDLFVEAFRHALRQHAGRYGELDAALLEESIDFAYGIGRREK